MRVYWLHRRGTVQLHGVPLPLVFRSCGVLLQLCAGILQDHGGSDVGVQGISPILRPLRRVLALAHRRLDAGQTKPLAFKAGSNDGR